MATQIGQLKYSVGFDVKKQDLNALKTQLQQLKKLSLSDLMKINDSDYAHAKQAFLQIREQAENVEKAVKQAFNVKLNTVNIETFNKNLKTAGTSLQQVYNTFKQGGTTGQNAFRSLASQVLTTNIQLKQTHKFLDNIATTLGNTIKWNVASTAVNALSNSVQQAWGYVKSLDTSLNDIMIVTGKSADQMAKFSEQANKAATTLGKTTVDYTKAALIYAQQGLSDEDIATRAAITLKTANVTGQSTDAVSEQLTSVWNGYKVNAQEAELYIDRLAAVAATTASNLEQLSTGMSKVAAAASAMGVGQDQLAAQLSTIISVTRQAPESVGTALRTVYARISDIKAGIDEDGVDLGRYSGKMAELGFNVLDVSGKLRDMGGVIEEIGGKWDSLTREQQISLAQTMAGQRQYSNLIALFDNFDKYTQALHTAQNAAGTLQKQQDTYMQSTRAYLNQLKAATQDLYDSLVNSDSIEPLIDGLTTVVSLGARFVDSLGGGGTVLASLGGIAANVFSRQIASGINTFIDNLNTAKLNADQVGVSIANINRLLQADNLDSKTRDILTIHADTYKKLAARADPKQFEILNNAIKETAQTYNNYVAALKEGSKNDAWIAKISQGSTKFKTFNDYLKATPKQQKQLDDSLKATEKGYTDLSIAIQKAAQEAEKNIAQQKASLSQGVDNGKGGTVNHQIDEATIKINAVQQAINNVNFDSGFEQGSIVVEKLNTKLQQLRTQNLNPEQLDAQIEAITQEFSELGNQASAAIDKLNTQIDPLRENVKKLGIQSENSSNKLKNIGKNIDAQHVVQDISKITGSFMQLTASVNQGSNAFISFAKGDWRSGLANFVPTLGMITTGAYSAATAMQDLGIATTIATGGLTAIVAVITIVTAGLIALANAEKQEKEAQIELNKQQIQTQKKKQEQIENNKKLYTSIEQLNKKYKQGEINRVELKSSIQDLVDQYGLQDNAISHLITNYQHLNEVIKEERINAARSGIASATEELQNYAELLTSLYATGAGYSKGLGKNKRFVYDISGAGSGFLGTALPKMFSGLQVSTGLLTAINPLFGLFGGASGGLAELLMRSDESKKVINALTQIQGANYNQTTGVLTFDVQQNEEALTKLYKDLSATLNIIQNEVDASDRVSQEYYNAAKDLMDRLQPIAQGYDAAAEKVKKYTNEFNILTSDADFTNIKTVNEYLKERQKIIDVLISKSDIENRNEAIVVADKYLRENYRQLFIEFGETGEFLDTLQKKFPKLKNEIQTVLVQAGPDAIGWIKDNIDIDNDINSWQQLKKIIQEIANTDLDNLQAVSESGKTATENYVYYQDLYNQIKSGKSISSTTFKDLQPELQSYFSKLANGQYKMIGDAQEFYNKVNSLKLSSFFDDITHINQQIEKTQALAQKPRNWAQLREQVNVNQVQLDSQGNLLDTNLRGTSKTKQLLQQQLDYIKTVGAASEQQIITWQSIIDNLSWSKQFASQLADTIEQAGNQTENLDQKLKDLEEELKRTDQAHYDAMNPIDTDIAEDQLYSLTQTIKELAKQDNEFAESLENDSRGAEHVAESILRFNNAIEDVVKNYDTWLDVLDDSQSSLQQIAQIMQPLRDAYADLLDIQGETLSNEFLQNTENLKLLKEATDGNLESYELLKQAVAKDIIQSINFDTQAAAEHFISKYKQIQSQIENEIGDITVNIGAEVSPSIKQKLQDLVNDAKMTAAQAEAFLKQAYGIDAEVINETKPVTEQQEWTGFESNIKLLDVKTASPLMGTPGTYIIPQVQYNPVKQSVKNTKQVTGTALKIITAKGSAGGKIKWNNSSQGAGAAGVSRRATQSKSKVSTTTKDFTKQQKDDRDIYRGINTELNQISRSLSRTQKQQNKLTGKGLIDNLNQQTKILEQHKVKLKQKNQLQKLDLDQKKAQLQLLGAQIDEYNHITNYMDLMGNKIGTINGYIQQENALIAEYNAATDKDAQDAVAKRLDEVQKQRKAAEDEKKDLETAIKNYDSLIKNIEDIVDQIEEQTQKQIQIQISKVRMKVEISVEMGDLARELNKFERDVLEGNDILNDSAFKTLYQNATLNFRDITSYFNELQGQSIKEYTDNINKLLQWQEEYKTSGIAGQYGDNIAALIEDLKNNELALANQMGSVQQLRQSIDQAYLNTIDDVNDNFKRQIQQYEFVTQELQHDMDLLQLLYGDKQYDAMQSYYNQLLQNDNQVLDSLRKQADFFKEMWENATDANVAKKYEQLWRDTLDQLNSAFEKSIKDAQDKYINAINKVYDELDKKLTGGLGTDYMQMEWQLINKNADEYLDTVNSIYAVQELERKYQDAIDDTTNLKHQQALTDLMNEQLDYLMTKEKLTQYDVDRAEKLLDIERARMALEDTRNAKTSMRLKRDSQGNYSYVYTASESDVDDAEGKLAQLQNDLYNFDKQAYRDNLNDMFSAYKEYLQKRKEIQLEYGTNLTPEQEAEKNAKLALLDDQYNEYINGKTKQNLQIRRNLTDSAFDDLTLMYDQNAANFEAMTNENYRSLEFMTEEMKNVLMPQLVTNWDGSIQQMSDKFNAEPDGFISLCKESFDQLAVKTNEYQNDVNKLAESAGEDLTNIKNGVDQVTDAYKELIPENQELINKMLEQIKTVDVLRDELDSLLGTYRDVWDAAKTAVQEAEKAVLAWDNAVKQAISNTNPDTSGITEATQSLPTAPQSISSEITPNLNDSNLIGNTQQYDKKSKLPSPAIASGFAAAIANGLWPDVNLATAFAEVVPSSMLGSYSISEMLQYINKEISAHDWSRANLKDYIKFGYDYLYDLKLGQAPSDDELDQYIKDFIKRRNKSVGRGTTLTKFDTGGYTGEWGISGRLAMLHQKQLVLNATDTKNMLDAVSILRNVVSNINGQISTRLGSLGNKTIYSGVSGQNIDQNVHIEANFPNVNSKREIEEAFSELVNLAAQRAMKRAR